MWGVFKLMADYPSQPIFILFPIAIGGGERPPINIQNPSSYKDVISKALELISTGEVNLSNTTIQFGLLKKIYSDGNQGYLNILITDDKSQRRVVILRNNQIEASFDFRDGENISNLNTESEQYFEPEEGLEYVEELGWIAVDPSRMIPTLTEVIWDKYRGFLGNHLKRPDFSELDDETLASIGLKNITSKTLLLPALLDAFSRFYNHEYKKNLKVESPRSHANMYLTIAWKGHNYWQSDSGLNVFPDAKGTIEGKVRVYTSLEDYLAWEYTSVISSLRICDICDWILPRGSNRKICGKANCVTESARIRKQKSRKGQRESVTK